MKKPFALLFLLLSACAVGPDYKRPTAASSDQFKETPAGWKEARPSDAIERGKWWEIFGDAELNPLAEKVAVSSQTLAAAEAQLRQAQAAVGVARAPFFPSIDANASATRSRSPSGAIGGTTAGRTVTNRS